MVTVIGITSMKSISRRTADIKNQRMKSDRLVPVASA